MEELLLSIKLVQSKSMGVYLVNMFLMFASSSYSTWSHLNALGCFFLKCQFNSLFFSFQQYFSLMHIMLFFYHV